MQPEVVQKFFYRANKLAIKRLSPSFESWFCITVDRQSIRTYTSDCLRTKELVILEKMHKSARKFLQYCNLGRCDYKTSLALQEKLIAEHLEALNTGASHTDRASRRNTLLLVEHDPVYTIGLRRNEFTQVDEEFLRRKGAQLFHTNRGGLITFHGPGQLVAYPILNLQDFRPSVKWYVCQLEEVLIRTCKEFGVSPGRTEHTGIWVDRAKIAAIGINCRRSVVSHGVALNCNTDLKWFDYIVPCGLEGFTVTSLSEQTGKLLTIADVLPVFVKNFAEVFNVTVEEVTEPDVVRLSQDRSTHSVRPLKST